MNAPNTANPLVSGSEAPPVDIVEPHAFGMAGG
jgi:hypothetical protein